MREELIWAHETLTNIIIDYVNKLDPVDDKEYIKLVFDVGAIAKRAIREQIYNEVLK
jgi:hypothetical protein